MKRKVPPLVRQRMGSGASTFCARAIAVAVTAGIGAAAIPGCGGSGASGAGQAASRTAGLSLGAAAAGAAAEPSGGNASDGPADGGAFLNALSAAGAASDPTSNETITREATAAVQELAETLFRVELACKDGSADESTLCEHPFFTDIATRYQRRWGHDVDPEHERGRIDALPRLGGFGQTVDQVVGRIALMCGERCTAASQYSWAGRVSDVIAGCKSGTASVKKSCAAITTLRARPAGASAGDAVERCVSECTDTRKDIATELAFERNRPRTKAAAASCLKKCMKGCDPGGWCGTCAMGCQMDCAMAVPGRPAPLQE